jgi:hypothetical protein
MIWAKTLHVFLDNARCRIKLDFIPPYCPQLNPIERPWSLMHRRVTPNTCYATCGQFAGATLDFLRGKVRENWGSFRDSVTDNFRVINPRDFRVPT